MGRDIIPTPTVIRHGQKKAVRFVTPSGVTAIVATSVEPELMCLLHKKLERKLRARCSASNGSR